MAESVNITFTPLRSSGSVPKGTTILNAARMLEIAMEGPCNGAGTCGKDLVQIRRDGKLETVLACKTILEDDTEVIVPSHNAGGTKIVEDFFSDNPRKRHLDPSVKKVVNTENGVTYTTVAIDGQHVEREERDTSASSYGIALDIGTTTMVASLTDLKTGSVIGRASTLNPLVYYGHDVMSRIKYSVSGHGGLLRMHREMISAINLLIDVMASDCGIGKRNIYMLLAAGNTTMQHIFLNMDIAGIGEYPYIAKTLEKVSTSAEDLGINIFENATITVFPCMSAYVGGDIVSGLMAADVEEGSIPTLFIDIGTNGEMALITNNAILATSTAAGPCFEGMTISCGMRAGEGAIEGVKMNDGVSLSVIADTRPRGICGSGIMDLVSEMIRKGLINQRGRLKGQDDADVSEVYRQRLFQKDGKRFFRLTDDVTFSQEDIRQVQLARAAIRTGVELLLSEGCIAHDQVKNVIIAGGFGYHLSRESLITVGLVPDLPNAKFSFVGNSSLEGAKMGLLNKDILDSSSILAQKAKVLELANVDGFEKRFVREMNFSSWTTH